HRRANQTAELPPFDWLATDALDDDPSDGTPLPACTPGQLAFLQYTSGSTGDAKGVRVTHANLVHNLEGLRLRWEMTPSSVMVTWLPAFHDLGLIFGILQPLYTGFPCVLMSPASCVQRPFRWLEVISSNRATHSLAPNFAYDLCATRISAQERASLDLRSWQMALNAAEPVRARTIDRFSELFAPVGFRREAFCPAYGLAEATLHVSGLGIHEEPSVARLDPHAFGAGLVVDAAPGQAAVDVVGCGQPAPAVHVAIVDPDSGSARGEDEIGEIWVAGESVSAGYLRRPDVSRDVFEARLASGEGPFLRTGDLGFLRGGQLYITGRLKDLIIIR